MGLTSNLFHCVVLTKLSQFSSTFPSVYTECLNTELSSLPPLSSILLFPTPCSSPHLLYPCFYSSILVSSPHYCCLSCASLFPTPAFTSVLVSSHLFSFSLLSLTLVSSFLVSFTPSLTLLSLSSFYPWLFSSTMSPLLNQYFLSPFSPLYHCLLSSRSFSSLRLHSSTLVFSPKLSPLSLFLLLSPCSFSSPPLLSSGLLHPNKTPMDFSNISVVGPIATRYIFKWHGNICPPSSHVCGYATDISSLGGFPMTYGSIVRLPYCRWITPLWLLGRFVSPNSTSRNNWSKQLNSFITLLFDNCL